MNLAPRDKGGEEIKITSKLNWFGCKRTSICPIRVFKTKFSQCELVGFVWTIRRVRKIKGTERKEINISSLPPSQQV